MIIALLTLFSMEAHAGELAEGWRGLPFGTPPAEAPSKDCSRYKEDWHCKESVGDVRVRSCSLKST
jgi:hypothetical protein